MLKITFFSAVSLACVTALAMEKVAIAPQVPLLVTLSYGKKEHALSLADAHIFTHQKVVDRVTNEEKIVGLHHYAHDRVLIREVAKGRLIEINDVLWIYTEEDIEGFHDGYPIYEGKVYPKKTFFPASWNKQRVLDYVKAAVEHNPCKWHETSSGFFKTYVGSCLVKADSIVLKVIVKSSPVKDVLISVYPESARKPLEKRCNVSSLALEQTRALEKKNHDKKIPNPKLIDAAQALDAERIQSLLKASCDPDVMDEMLRTPLMIVAQKGRYDLIADLLEYGAKVVVTDSAGTHYVKDKRGRSVLEYALQSGNEFAVLPLLQPSNNALLSELNKEGETPLICAVKALSLDLVRLLLSFGANPNQPDSNGFTPLMHVAKLLNLKKEQLHCAQCILDVLVEYGADIDAQNEKSKRQKGFTALMCAVEAGSEELVGHLLELCADYELATSTKLTALVLATNKKHDTIVKLLYTYDQQKQLWKKEHNATELMFAAHKNNLMRLKKVVKKDTVNHQGRSSESALLFAVEHNNVEAVTVLIGAGSDPRMTCYGAMSIYAYIMSRHDLHQDIKDAIADAYEVFTQPAREASIVKERQRQRTIEQFKKEVAQGTVTVKTVEALKKCMPCSIAGGSFSPGSPEVSPLLFAIRERRPSVVKSLCAHKEFFQEGEPLALAYARDDLESLEHLVMSKWVKQESVHALFLRVLEDKRADMVTLLESLPHFWFSLLKEAIVKCDTECLIEISKRAHNLLSNDLIGVCLWQAIKSGSKDAVEAIITYFPESKNYKDENGSHPLMYAAQERQPGIFQLLCEHGCNVEGTDKEGKRVRDVISVKTAEGQAMMRVLLQHEGRGAVSVLETKKEQEKMELTAKGWTPSMIAAHQQDLDTLKAVSAEEINRTGKDGRTPLMVAIQENKKGAVDTILAHSDVDLDIGDTKFRTALFYAAEGHDDEYVEKLLANKALVIVWDYEGKTVFDKKCSKNSKRLLRKAALHELKLLGQHNVLLPHDFDHFGFSDDQKRDLGLWLIEKSGAVLLDQLCAHCKNFSELLRKELTEYTCISYQDLLLFGSFYSDVRPQEKETKKAFEGFFKSFTVATVDVLLKYKLMDAADILSTAIAVEKVDVIHYLLERTDVMRENSFVRVGAEWARAPGLRANVISSICARRGIGWYLPFIKNDDALLRIPVFLWAWFLDKKDIIKLFIKDPGTDLNVRDGYHALPYWLYLAFTYHDDEELMALLSQRDDINPNVDILGGTALLRSCGENLVKASTFLLSKKNLKKQDEIALANDMLGAMKTDDVISLWQLRPDIVSSKALLLQAAKQDKVDLLKRLLQSAEVKTSTNDLNTFLVIACYAGHPRMVEFLLTQKGIDCNAVVEPFESAIDTPLVAACSGIVAAREQIVKQLLQQPGINIRLKGRLGKTALEIAQDHANEGIVDLLKRFEQKGIAAIAENAYTLVAAAKKFYEQKDYAQAYEHFNQAYHMYLAPKVRMYVAYYLGRILNEGLGVQPDAAKAAEYFEVVVNTAIEGHNEAEEARKAEACCFLAKMYYKGDVLPKDYQKTIDLYEKAYEQHYSQWAQAEAAIGLAGYYVSCGHYQLARKCCLKAANQNVHERAREQAAHMLEVFKDTQTEDVVYVRAPSEASSNSVEQPITDHIETGKALYESKNYEKAYHCFEHILQQEPFGARRAEAAYYLGCMRNRGVTIQDYVQAAHYFEEVDMHTDSKILQAGARRYLGEMYELGRGKPMDFKIAFDYYSHVIDQADNLAAQAEAFVMLGGLYHDGKGVRKSYSKAAECFERAENNEHSPWAQASAWYYLGSLYSRGLAVEKDFEQARKYLKKAVGQSANLRARDSALKILKILERDRQAP